MLLNQTGTIKSQKRWALTIIIATLFSICCAIIITSFIFVEPSALHQRWFDFGDPAIPRPESQAQEEMVNYFGTKGYYAERMGFYIIKVSYQGWGTASKIWEPSLNNSFSLASLFLAGFCLIGVVLTCIHYFRNKQSSLKTSSFVRINITITLVLIALCILSIVDKPHYSVNAQNAWWQCVNGSENGPWDKSNYYDVDWHSLVFNHNWQADTKHFFEESGSSLQMYSYSLAGVIILAVFASIIVFILLDFFIGVVVSVNRYSILTKYKIKLLDDTVSQI